MQRPVDGCGQEVTTAGILNRPEPSVEDDRPHSQRHRTNAGVEGSVTIDLKAGSGYMITTTVTGLRAGSGHGIHLHNGTCDHIDLAGVDVRVGHGVADVSGRLVVSDDLPGIWAPTAGGEVLTVHGNDPPLGIFEDQYTAIACTQLAP